MTGLLSQITKQLMGTQKSVVIKNVHPKTTTPVNIKPLEQPVEIDRTVKCERIKTEVEREDYLLNQIDEFREKAQQLQELLLSKESRAVELQSIVDEREVKAKELEEILKERQQKADGITEEVSKQIDSLIEKVSAKMEEIGTTIGTDLKEGQKLSAEQVAKLRETLESLTEQLDTLKGELSEKVHSENVKCYRNVADLFKSMDEKLDALEKKNNDLTQKLASVHTCIIALLVIAVFGILAISAIQLYGMGVFHLIFR